MHLIFHHINGLILSPAQHFVHFLAFVCLTKSNSLEQKSPIIVYNLYFVQYIIVCLEWINYVEI